MNIARTICLGFLAVITVGTILLMMPFSTSDGSWNSPLVALFTSTSAVCVTGLAVVDTGSDFSFWGQLFILLLIQVGGLGYMTINSFLMLLIGRKFDFRQKLAIQDSFDRPFLQGSRNLVRSILATTLIFELTGALLLIYFFARENGLDRGLWLGLFHSISAWNNAGFSLFSDSLVAYQSSLFINIVISGLIIFGGIGYQVIIELYLWADSLLFKRGRYCFSLNFKVVTSTTLVLLIMGTITMFFAEFSNSKTLANLDWQSKILTAGFQSVTTRTAGFNTIDIGSMSVASLFIVMGLMFVGASPSGTAGGIKTTTLRILATCTRAVLRGKEEVILYQRSVPVSLILKAIAVAFGSAMFIAAATIFVAIFNSNFPFLRIFFEVISAFSTTGLSTGITADLSAVAKLTLIATMYAGRVGILALIAAIIGESVPSAIEYPEENLLVG